MQGRDEVPIYPDLAGKVAVVTGGSGGIGAATCRLLAANGAKVAVNGRDQARIDTVLDAIRADGGQAIGRRATAPTWPRSNSCASRSSSASAQPRYWLRSWAVGGRVPARSPRSLRRTGTPPWTAA